MRTTRKLITARRDRPGGAWPPRRGRLLLHAVVSQRRQAGRLAGAKTDRSTNSRSTSRLLRRSPSTFRRRFALAAAHESACGPSATSLGEHRLSAFGGEAVVPQIWAEVRV